MATFKYIVNFEDVSSASWSETYYRQADDLETAANVPELFITERLDLLAPANTMRSIRISSVANNRQALPKPINRVGLGVAGDISSVGQALVLSLGSSIVPSSRRLWLRGWPSNSYRREDNGKLIIHPGAQAALNDFYAALKAGSFVIYPLQRIAVGGLVLSDIDLVDGHTNPGYTWLRTKAAHGLAPGERCIVSKMNKQLFPRLNGRYSVVATDGLKVLVKYDLSKFPDDIGTTGKIRKEAYSSGAVINPLLCGVSHLRTRDTKSPHSRSRGSRRAATGAK